MDNDDRGDDSVEESVVAKSTGQQEEKDIALKDAAALQCLDIKEKDDKREGRLQRTRKK